MSQPDNILDPSQLQLQGDFNSQVFGLLQHVRLARSQVEELSVLFDHLEYTLNLRWPGSKVYPFGSIVTGLGIQTSDVDCFVALPPQWRTKTVSKKKHDPIVHIAKNLLAQHPKLFGELQAIPMAKVPIVKFFHIPTQRHCDVNFKSPSGVENTKLIAHLLHVDRMALDLAIIIKYWSKVHNLTGTNLMPNYTLTMLVIFFLQQQNILPSVRQLQRQVEPYIIDNWNTAFDENYKFSMNNLNKSLYTLLGSFFQYYSTFDFSVFMVSPYLGCPIPKDIFKNVETVSDVFELYKYNLAQGHCLPLRLHSMLCVQDPFEHCRNCSVAVFPKLAQKFHTLVQHAANKFKEVPSEDFLRAIFTKLPGLDVAAPKIQQRPNKVDKIKTTAHRRTKIKGIIRTAFLHYRRNN